MRYVHYNIVILFHSSESVWEMWLTRFVSFKNETKAVTLCLFFKGTGVKGFDLFFARWRALHVTRYIFYILFVYIKCIHFYLQRRFIKFKCIYIFDNSTNPEAKTIWTYLRINIALVKSSKVCIQTYEYTFFYLKMLCTYALLLMQRILMYKKF